MPNRKKSPIIRHALLFAIAALAALTGCKKTSQTRSQPPVPVATGTAARKTVPVTVRAIGHVEPIATVDVKSRVAGAIIGMHFREGQSVREGEKLFDIDPLPYQAALRQAEAQLARSKALAKKAETDVKRYADLVAKDFVTKEQYDQIVANSAALGAAAQADQASVDNAQLQLSYCTITAPIAGRLGNLNVKPGNLIKANEDRALTTINQVKPIDVSFTVPAQYLPAISANHGRRLTVVATLPDHGDRQEKGTLSFIDNNVDRATSTVLLKATFPNERERLWTGQFVDVTLVLGEEPDRVVVPAAAVQTGQQGDYVFVVKEDNTVELRSVKVARHDENEAVIDSGLTGEETVVTDGQLRLVPGAKIVAKGAASGSQEQ